MAWFHGNILSVSIYAYNQNKEVRAVSLVCGVVAVILRDRYCD